jgi:hypothetical protein
MLPTIWLEEKAKCHRRGKLCFFLSHREVLKKNTTQKHNVDITLSPEEERSAGCNAEVARSSEEEHNATAAGSSEEECNT